MKLDCIIEERISQKTGRPYYVLIVNITDNYKKIIFLTKSEYELIKLVN